MARTPAPFRRTPLALVTSLFIVTAALLGGVAANAASTVRKFSVTMPSCVKPSTTTTLTATITNSSRPRPDRRSVRSSWTAPKPISATSRPPAPSSSRDSDHRRGADGLDRQVGVGLRLGFGPVRPGRPLPGREQLGRDPRPGRLDQGHVPGDRQVPHRPEALLPLRVDGLDPEHGILVQPHLLGEDQRHHYMRRAPTKIAFGRSRVPRPPVRRSTPASDGARSGCQRQPRDDRQQHVVISLCARTADPDRSPAAVAATAVSGVATFSGTEHQQDGHVHADTAATGLTRTAVDLVRTSRAGWPAKLVFANAAHNAAAGATVSRPAVHGPGPGWQRQPGENDNARRSRSARARGPGR